MYAYKSHSCAIILNAAYVRELEHPLSTYASSREGFVFQKWVQVHTGGGGRSIKSVCAIFIITDIQTSSGLEDCLLIIGRPGDVADILIEGEIMDLTVPIPYMINHHIGPPLVRIMRLVRSKHFLEN